MIAKLSSYLSKTKRIFKDRNEVIIVLFVYFVEQVFADGIWSTTSGPIRGTTSMVDDVQAFLGIPYAEPPVGDLRFAKPFPKNQWREVYNASKISAPCTQISIEPYYFFPDVTNMSEDCLYLNIWVPKQRYTKGLRPIMIFIHGGLFVFGSTSLNVYDGSKLAKQGDLIVATINYRLGSFGYFLANIEEANGNMGMYDQVMAIEWIKNNAMNFGGDPENIVLIGESVGSASISAHMVSPLSKHLFKRAIMQSGSIIVPNFQDENVRLIKNSQMLASVIGCTNETANLNTDPQEVVRCLKRQPAEKFMAIEKTLFKSEGLTFFPRMNDEFLPTSSRDAFLEGKFRKDIDVLLGVNRDEGTMMLAVVSPEYFGYYGRDNIQSISKRLAVILSTRLMTITGYTNTSEVINSYMELMRDHSSDSYTKMIADIFGDLLVGCGTKFNAELLSLKGNNVYFYNFEFRAASTPMADWIGVTHMDELQYVFGNSYHDNFTAEEVELSTRLMDRWSAFAKTGNPNIPDHIQWPRYSYHEPLYMNIGQEEETIQRNPLDRCEIWRKRFKVEIDNSRIRLLQNSGKNINRKY